MSRLGATLAMVPLALALGCAPPREHRPISASPDAGVAIDTDVMAYLSMARAMHHEANLKEDGDVAGAIAALDHVTSANRPHPGQRVPEIEEVLADTFARKAELEVRAGDTSKAAESVREGLRHAPDETYFRGHLLEVGGIAEEARSAALGDAGQTGEAAKAKARALDLLHQAVVVQERVVNASLASDGGSSGGDR